MVSFRGQKKLGPRPDRSPLGVQFKISDEHPHLFHMRSIYLYFVVNQIKLQRQTYKISSNVPEIDRYVGYLRLV